MSRKKNHQPGRLKQIVSEARGPGIVSYPFSVPAIAALDCLEVAPTVTFFVGENGSGKSTLVEAVAIRAGLNPEGGSRNLAFETRASESELHQCIELVWERQPTAAFFLRAETFYNTATAYEDIAIAGLHERSHGESFLEAFCGSPPIIRPGAFVVMDEPESALSVNGQLKVMRAMYDLVETGSQFVVATHSPILLTFPGALIYELSRSGIQRVGYDETDAYQLTKAFLEAPERFLRHLLSDE